MTQDDNHKQEYFRRIRRVKRFLRPLPRRSNVHRYPVLKWFAKTARKRSYLWSFHKANVIPAIYVGSILAMLPPPTPQFPLALLFGLLLHCNLMVAASLTLITNPFTVVPIYYADYKVGGFIMDLLWSPKLLEEITPEIMEIYNDQTDIATEVKLTMVQRIFDGWTQTAVGGLTLGVSLGLLLHLIYLLLAKRYGKGTQSRYSLLGSRKDAAGSTAPAVTDNADTGKDTADGSSDNEQSSENQKS